MTPSDGDIELAAGVSVPAAELSFTFARSSGPGGQSVNKVSTQARLRVAVSAIVGLDDAARDRLRTLAGQRLTVEDEILIRASAARSQLANRRACVERLADLVARAATRPRVRKPTRPSRSMVEKRLKAKREQSEKKQRRQGLD